MQNEIKKPVVQVSKLECEIEVLEKERQAKADATSDGESADLQRPGAEEKPAEAAVNAEDGSSSSSSDSDSSTCPYCREAAEVEQKLRKRVRSAHKAGCKNRKRRKGGGRQKESVQKKA